MTKIYEKFCVELDGLLADVEHGFRQLGDCLVRAAKELFKDEYDKLEERLLNRGLKKADLNAMKAVANGKLDKRLFFCGVQHPKLARLPASDQALLFTGVEFDIRTGEDAFEKKCWAAMEDDERKQLVGEGKKLLPWREQNVPGESVRNRITWTFNVAKYKGGQLELEGGTQFGAITRPALAVTLFKNGGLAEYIADLQADLANLSKTAVNAKKAPALQA